MRRGRTGPGSEWEKTGPREMENQAASAWLPKEEGFPAAGGNPSFFALYGRKRSAFFLRSIERLQIKYHIDLYPDIRYIIQWMRRRTHPEGESIW